MRQDELNTLLLAAWDRCEHPDMREDDCHEELLSHVASYLRFDRTHPIFEADDLRQHIVEVEIITEALQDAIPAAESRVAALGDMNLFGLD
jgi:hypothetical protein